VDPSGRTIRKRIRARRLLDAVLAGGGCLALVLVVVSAATGDATGWSIERVPAASVSPLSSVSCASIRSCTAVGGALVERWNGSRWTSQDVSVPPGPFDLTGVSCSSTRACIAVGSYSLTSSGEVQWPLAEHWDGNRWSHQLLPGPAGGAFRSISLRAVSCASNTACTAVGDGAFVERWDGGHWYLQHTPLAEGATLAAVSCASRRTCVAVGGRNGRAFVERWDGRRWSIQRFPAGPSYLYGISCPSPSICFAVGGQASPAALVGRWDGRRWSIEQTPRSVSTYGSQETDVLSGVSCTSDTVCTAVGSARDEAGQMEELAERRTGARWTIQLPPSTAHAAGVLPGNVLDGVSCAALTSCVAVGSQLLDPVSVTLQALVERWNATLVPTVTG
jgi:hypothetical protein